MQIQDFCTVFPASQNEWPNRGLDRALPFHLRAKVRTRFGAMYSASDISKRKIASRTGFALRPFEAGDSLNALSRPHLMKTNELVTRTDYAPGRQRAGIIFHGYGNMLYHSDKSPANKGQVALGVCALIEAAHKSLGHTCDFLGVFDSNLETGLEAATKKIRRWDYTYIVSDLLFAPQALHASTQELLAGLLKAHAKHPCLFIIRDATEWVSNASDVGVQKELLIPYLDELHSQEKRKFFSGDVYLENLRSQYLEAVNQIERQRGSVYLATAQTSVDDISDSLFFYLQRKTVA